MTRDVIGSRDLTVEGSAQVAGAIDPRAMRR